MSFLKQMVLIGCIFSACATPPPHAKWAEKVARSFSEMASEMHGFKSLGCGGNFSNQKIELLYIDFETKKELIESEAKALLVTTIDDFIVYVNKNEEIIPYLKVYPITPNEISASIAFVNEKGEVDDGFLQIDLFGTTIHYSKFDINKKEYISYKEETYPFKS